MVDIHKAPSEVGHILAEVAFRGVDIVLLAVVDRTVQEDTVLPALVLVTEQTDLTHTRPTRSTIMYHIHTVTTGKTKAANYCQVRILSSTFLFCVTG